MVYDKLLLMCFAISNMLTLFLPPKTFARFSSALILRFSLASCSLFFLMYSHTFLVISVRGSGLLPTTALRAALGVIGFMKAALGFLFAFAFAGLAAFFTAFFTAFLAGAFFAFAFAFLVAITNWF
ncbi:MAG TPA: hypothetical protein VG603_04415 [Chitinophagales bacterium]|nr:hypothetical protein [Chitinophagales bacterium]